MIKRLLLISLCLWGILYSYGWTANASIPTQTVIVTEMVPGAECRCIYANATANDDNGNPLPLAVAATPGACSSNVAVKDRKYECTVQSGLAGFQGLFATIVRWILNITLLLGVLAVVGLGIAWSFSGGDDAKAKSTLKKWAINILIGFIILLFFRYILQFLAPWIYT